MLVDKESLYNVDDETFKREVYGITKENEDLQIESSRGSIITPLRPLKDKIRDKSKNKSPTQKKKKKGIKNDELKFQIVESQTWEKLEL